MVTAKMNDAWYLKVVHVLPVRHPEPDEFVGPFFEGTNG